MTDPELADATYVEPITPEYVAAIIAKERPDAVLPTMGGQTALNTALALYKDGTLEKYGVKMIGADADGDREGRGPPEVPRGDGPDRARKPALGDRPQPSMTPWRRSSMSACRRSSGRASPSAAPAAASPTIASEFVDDRPRRARRLADHRGADRGIGARAGRNMRWRWSATAPTTPSSSARSRMSTRWASTPAIRSRSRRR